MIEQEEKIESTKTFRKNKFTKKVQQLEPFQRNDRLIGTIPTQFQRCQNSWTAVREG